MTSPISSNWFYYMTMASIAKAMPSIDQTQNTIGSTGNKDNSLFFMLLNAAMQGGESNSTSTLPLGENQMFPQLDSFYTPLNIQNTGKSNITVSSNVTSDFTFKPIQFMKLDNGLEGKLSGTAVHFINAGKKYNIHPGLLSSIAIHETGNGSSKAVNEKLNVAGMMGKDGLKRYESIEDSIFDMARNLRQNYLDHGIDTVAKIGAKYAPIGVSNDPTGLNNHWVQGVNRHFNNLS